MEWQAPQYFEQPFVYQSPRVRQIYCRDKNAVVINHISKVQRSAGKRIYQDPGDLAPIRGSPRSRINEIRKQLIEMSRPNLVPAKVALQRLRVVFRIYDDL